MLLEPSSGRSVNLGGGADDEVGGHGRGSPTPEQLVHSSVDAHPPCTDQVPHPTRCFSSQRTRAVQRWRPRWSWTGPTRRRSQRCFPLYFSSPISRLLVHSATVTRKEQSASFAHGAIAQVGDFYLALWRPEADDWREVEIKDKNKVRVPASNHQKHNTQTLSCVKIKDEKKAKGLPSIHQ